MRVLVIVCLPGLLTACQSEVGDAEAQLKVLEQSHASPRELCNGKRKVADAYLKAHDQKKYEESKLYADIECNGADIRQLSRQ